MPVTYPAESADYRIARNQLLQEEIALRDLTERVAARRRSLPDGGIVPHDYLFRDTAGKDVRMSAFFRSSSRTLAIYSLMFRPDQAAPCPMCSSMLDGLNGQAPHISQHLDLVVVAKATPTQLRQLAETRGWTNLTLCSVGDSGYQADYNAEAPDGSQLPMMNVFRASDSGIRHFWGSEMFHAELDGHPRHVDPLWPLWNMLDLTPAGRPDWFPALNYDG